MGNATNTAPASGSKDKGQRMKAKRTKRKRAAAPVRFDLDAIRSRPQERPEGRGVPPRLHPKQMLVLETANTDRDAVQFELDPKADPKLFIREFRRGLRRHRKGVKMFSAIRPGGIVLLWVAKPAGALPAAAPADNGVGAAVDEPEDRPDREAREADLRDA